MAQISPFTGIRFDLDSVPRLYDVVAPPYDVLSRDDVTALHSRSAHNVTHLTRPESYQGAATLWEDWRTQGILTQDREAVYLYRQVFDDPETGLTMPARVGLVCVLHLEDYSTGTVRPHENTIAAHRADRLELMRTTHANLESIYGLYSDDSGEAMRLLKEMEIDSPVVAQVRGVLGSDHVLQRIEDGGVIASLQNAINGRPVLIADGHHRYETALAYQREFPDEPGSGGILITLTAFQDEGLLVLPTHRLVRGITPEMIESLPARLDYAGFDVAVKSADMTPLDPGTLGFDMILSGGAEYRAVLPPGADMASRIHSEESDAWKALDVTVLHKLVIEEILGIPMAQLSSTDQVRYTRDETEARQKVLDNEFEVAFLLARPSLSSIRAVSEAGDRMPQKSTFFYPKLLSGLVMRSLT